MNETDSTAPTPGIPCAWVLGLLVVAAWWPLGTWWQSDDLLALNYTHDFGRALSDFWGPQYGATDIWFFYRPLITLSFAVEQLVGGGEPFVSHLSNVLAHGTNAVLVALLWSRFAPPAGAFCAGLLWGLLPSHAGSVLWAVGRVDSHTTLWILLSLWWLVRFWEGERGRTASLVCAALALCSKELGAVVPALVFALSCAWEREAPLARRLRSGLRSAIPYVLLVALWFVLRKVVLGVFVGGYVASTFAPGAMAVGLSSTFLDLVNPLRTVGFSTLTSWVGDVPQWIVHLGFLPVILALALAVVRRRGRVLLMVTIGFLLAAVPMMPFWSVDFLQTLRYWYLPTAVLVGWFAVAGPVPALALLLVSAAPFVAMRESYRDMHGSMGQMHRTLVREAREAPPGDLFVAGLPVRSPDGLCVGFHFGVDRLLLPPFADGRHRVRPVRPILNRPQAHLLHAADVPFALPGATTWYFDGPGILGGCPERTVPAMDVAQEGLPDFSTAALEVLAAAGPGTAFLTTKGVRGPWYRITVFTSIGYLCALVPDAAAEAAADGRVDLFELLSTARIGTSSTALRMFEALPLPTTVDLEPVFPVLVEAGTVIDVLGRPMFTPLRRAGELLRWTFDRKYPALVRRMQGVK